VSTRQVLRLGEAIYTVLRRAGLSDQAVIGTVHALLTIYILGFVSKSLGRHDPETSDGWTLWAYEAAIDTAHAPWDALTGVDAVIVSTLNQLT
jgi:hypothetical protein